MKTTTLAKIFMISLITLCHSHVRSEKLVDSPLLKEIEYKKAMLNRKPSQNKTILVRKKPNRMLKPIYQPRLSPETGSLEKGKLSYLEGNTTQAKSESRKSNLKETPASDRMFLPPYKYPLWGMPYGIYSNGGFVNPGLFPFVPGGPGFPPYDGIFGGPFGPGPGSGAFPPPGVPPPISPAGAPVIAPSIAPPPPAAPAAVAASGKEPIDRMVLYGQPPLNLSGPPPGAYSPGSPVGYRKPPERPPAGPPKPQPTRSRPKPKPRPRTTPTPETHANCGCTKHHRPSGSYRYEAPQPPSYGYNNQYRKPKPPPPSTSAPCPYHYHSPTTPAPQYAQTPAPYSPPAPPQYSPPPTPAPYMPPVQPQYPTPAAQPAYSPPSQPMYAAPVPPPQYAPASYSPPPTPAPYSPPPPPSQSPQEPPPYYAPAPPAPSPPSHYYAPAPTAPPPSPPPAPQQPSTSAPYYPPSPSIADSTTTPTPPPSNPPPPSPYTSTTPAPSAAPSQDPPPYTSAPTPGPQEPPSSTPAPPSYPTPPPQPTTAAPATPAPMGWQPASQAPMGWNQQAPLYLSYQPMSPPPSPPAYQAPDPQPPAPPASSKAYQAESSEHLPTYQSPPAQYIQSHHHHVPNHRIPTTRKPCKLKVRPKVQKLFPFEYNPHTPAPTPPPTSAPPPPSPRSKKPCPYKVRAQLAEMQQQQQSLLTSTTTTTPAPKLLTPQPSLLLAEPSVISQMQYQSSNPIPVHIDPEDLDEPGTIIYKPNPQEIVHTPSGSVTVPLPFPFVFDSNGVLRHENPSGSQQVTYKLDMNPELITKISTPLVINGPPHNPYNPMRHYSQISRSGSQTVIDHEPMSSASTSTLTTASQSPPQVIVLETKPKVSRKPAQQPTVVVLNTDSTYDYPSQDASSTIPISYIRSAQPQLSLPDYSYMLSDRNRGVSTSSSLFEDAIQDYPREKPRRTKTGTDNKSYVIIDKDELDELQKSTWADDSPELVQLQYHSQEAEEDDEEEVYTKPVYSYAQKRYKKRKQESRRTRPEQKRQSSSSYTEYGDSPGSNSFSAIFEMNNEDIRSIGRSRKRPTKKKRKPERLTFDTYIREVDVDEDK